MSEKNKTGIIKYGLQFFAGLKPPYYSSLKEVQYFHFDFKDIKTGADVRKSELGEIRNLQNWKLDLIGKNLTIKVDDHSLLTDEDMDKYNLNNSPVVKHKDEQIKILPKKIDIKDSELIPFSIPKNQFPVFKYLIPSKRREEVLGDLLETRCQMERDGVVRWKIRLVLFCQKIMIGFALLRMRLTDFGKAKKVEK